MTYDELLKYNIEHVKNSIPGIDKRIGCSKKELSKFLDISIATINRDIADGKGIPYIKGDNAKCRVYFTLIDIAMYLTNRSTQVKTA